MYGRRRLLIASGAVFATAPFLYLLVTDAWQLILIRVYHGFATATFMPVALASTADLFPQHRGRMMSLFASSTMIGRLLAPTVGGILIGVGVGFLTAFQLPYLICGLSGAAALLLALRLRVGRGRKPLGRGGGFSRLATITKNRLTLLTASAESLTYLGVGAVESFLPLYALSLGLEPWARGPNLPSPHTSRTAPHPPCHAGGRCPPPRPRGLSGEKDRIESVDARF